MKAKGIIAILAIVGLLVFVAVSVLGGSKEKVASTRTTLRGSGEGGQSQIGGKYSVELPRGTKDIPQQVNYQGYLVNSSDSSAVTDTLQMIFKIYDDPDNGNLLWSETQSEVPVINGLFNVLLGSFTQFPDTLFTGQELWLGTTVGDETLSPRKKLVSVPYAFKDDCWTSSGDDCYFDKSGNVGIGTTSPAHKLDVYGTIFAAHVANDAGIYMDAVGGSYGRIQATNAADTAAKDLVLQPYGGNVGIGTTNPGGVEVVVVLFFP